MIVLLAIAIVDNLLDLVASAEMEVLVTALRLLVDVATSLLLLSVA